LRGEFVGHVFVPLFEEPEVSESFGLLTSRLASGPSLRASCVKPPIGGLAFISTVGEVSDILDRWWSKTVPPDLLPVLIALHEPEFERWVEHLDAEAIVGVSGELELALYSGLANVHAVVSQDAQTLSHLVTQRYPACFQVDSSVLPEVAAPIAAPPPEPHLEVSLEDGGTDEGKALRSLVDRAAGMLGSASHGAWLPEELKQLAVSHSLGRIVGVTSRAGGVGKTAIAAALGIVYGEAVQDTGWTAAVVDQNIGNPDQPGRLTVDAQVPTVSQIMADIESGSQWSVPAWNRTPALAVYPERRDVSDAYATGQVERFAAQLRQLHALSVIDLPNRIPSYTSPESALCAAWLSVADLLIVPTTDDPTRLQGVLDYLDAPMVQGDVETEDRPVRVIVAYQRSPLRAVREDPGVRALLAEIGERVSAVVEIPKNERATLAVVRGQPITEVDARLRSAFVELALTVARVLGDG
jgi:MinD-like ATPase involved in chromosome partitioning or flagellar assembly